jgi:hypothetical protein
MLQAKKIIDQSTTSPKLHVGSQHQAIRSDLKMSGITKQGFVPKPKICQDFEQG